MANQDVVSYIEKQRALGMPDLTIKDTLIGAGWKEQDVVDGFLALGNVDELVKAVTVNDNPTVSKNEGIVEQGTLGAQPEEVKAEAATPKSKKLVAIIAGVLVFFIAVGAAAGYVVINKLHVPFIMDDHTIVSKAFYNTISTGGVSYQGTFSYNATQNPLSSSNIFGNDIATITPTTISGSFSGMASLTNGLMREGKASFESQNIFTLPLRLVFATKSVNGASYLALEEASAFPYSPIVANKDAWYLVDDTLLGDGTVAVGGDIGFEKVARLFFFNAEAKAKLVEAIQGGLLFTTQAKLADVLVDGKKMYHFRIIPKEDAILSLYETTSSAQGIVFGDEDKMWLRSWLGGLALGGMELWIDAKSLLVAKVAFTSNLKDTITSLDYSPCAIPVATTTAKQATTTPCVPLEIQQERVREVSYSANLSPANASAIVAPEAPRRLSEYLGDLMFFSSFGEPTGTTTATTTTSTTSPAKTSTQTGKIPTTTTTKTPAKTTTTTTTTKPAGTTQGSTTTSQPNQTTNPSTQGNNVDDTEGLPTFSDEDAI